MKTVKFYGRKWERNNIEKIELLKLVNEKDGVNLSDIRLSDIDSVVLYDNGSNTMEDIVEIKLKDSNVCENVLWYGMNLGVNCDMNCGMNLSVLGDN